MRLLFALPLLLCGCGQHAERGANSVDIDAAAAAAENSVENYAAGAAAPIGPRPATMVAAPLPAPVPSPTVSPAPLDPSTPAMPGDQPDDPAPAPGAPITADSTHGAANAIQAR